MDRLWIALIILYIHTVTHIPVLYIPAFECSVSYQLTRQRATQFVRLLEYLIERTVGSVQWVDYVGYALM